MKYAIKVPFGVDKTTKEPTDWIYVVDLDGVDDELSVVVYDSQEEAETAARAWRVSKVVEYNVND